MTHLPFSHYLSLIHIYEYSNFKVNRTTFNADDELIFEVDVKNVGERAGKETVLLLSLIHIYYTNFKYRLSPMWDLWKARGIYVGGMDEKNYPGPGW